MHQSFWFPSGRAPVRGRPRRYLSSRLPCPPRDRKPLKAQAHEGHRRYALRSRRPPFLPSPRPGIMSRRAGSSQRRGQTAPTRFALWRQRFIGILTVCPNCGSPYRSKGATRLPPDATRPHQGSRARHPHADRSALSRGSCSHALSCSLDSPQRPCVCPPLGPMRPPCALLRGAPAPPRRRTPARLDGRAAPQPRATDGLSPPGAPLAI